MFYWDQAWFTIWIFHFDNYFHWKEKDLCWHKEITWAKLSLRLIKNNLHPFFNKYLRVWNKLLKERTTSTKFCLTWQDVMCLSLLFLLEMTSNNIKSLFIPQFCTKLITFLLLKDNSKNKRVSEIDLGC